MRVFGFGNGGADGHEYQRLPQAAQGGEREHGDDGNGDEVARGGGKDVAEQIGEQVGAHVFHLRHDEIAKGEGDMRQAAEDVAWVFAAAAFDEVEKQDEQQGNAPNADHRRQAKPEGEGDAEQ